MPIVRRRYLPRGPSAQTLQRSVSSSAEIAEFSTGVVDIDVDDAVDGVIDTLDQFMDVRGFAFDQQAPPTETETTIKSPDGSTWLLRIDNAGALTTTKL